MTIFGVLLAAISTLPPQTAVNRIEDAALVMQLDEGDLTVVCDKTWYEFDHTERNAALGLGPWECRWTSS